MPLTAIAGSLLVVLGNLSLFVAMRLARGRARDQRIEVYLMIGAFAAITTTLGWLLADYSSLPVSLVAILLDVALMPQALWAYEHGYSRRHPEELGSLESTKDNPSVGW